MKKILIVEDVELNLDLLVQLLEDDYSLVTAMNGAAGVEAAEKERPEDGRTIRRQERSMYDPQTRLRHTENRYEVLDGHQVIYSEEHRRSPELRNYALAQLLQLLQEAGYREIRAVSGYSDEPATEEDGTFSIMASKAK